jgi:hypothetical protein
MAAPIQFANGPLPQAPNTTLTGSIPSSGGTTVTVAAATYLPAVGPFQIIVDNERIEVDSISGTTLTILSGGRAQEGTTATSHSSGANVYQVLSVANLARHIDDRAAKGVIDQAEVTSDTTLSTTAGTYSTIISTGNIPLLAGRLYKITATIGAYLLIGGSGGAANDTWRFRIYRNIAGGGAATMRTNAAGRINVASGGVVTLPVMTGTFSPPADGNVDFLVQGAKTAGASTVTSTVSVDAGEGYSQILVEDVGAWTLGALH